MPDKLFIVRWSYKGNTASDCGVFEHVWAINEKEAKIWADKHTAKGQANRVSWVFAAATTSDLRTPPGLETYRVARGEKL